MIRVEICIETPQGIEAATSAGADRLELCASLDVGGLTPSMGLMQYAAQRPLPAPVSYTHLTLPTILLV